MQKILLGTLAVSALSIGLATAGVASPATRLLDRDAVGRTSSVEPVYYYYNHHRYRHRSWDKRYRRWRYY